MIHGMVGLAMLTLMLLKKKTHLNLTCEARELDY
jgi:hypothetical protein